MTLRQRLATLRESRVPTVAAVILLIAAVAPFVAFAVPQTVGADTSYVVVSSSMRPTIHANDAILVTHASPADVEEGDIIVFERAGDSIGDDASVTSHRVVEVIETEDGRQFRTKGDALEEADPQLVPASALIGRVTIIIPDIGHVIEFSHSGTGFLVLVVVPVGLLILNELWNLARLFLGSDDDVESGSEGSTPPEAEPSER